MKMNNLIKLEKYCEENKKCPICNDFSLVGCNPEFLLLMCEKCGNFFDYDKEEDKIIKLKEEQEKK